ncbi:MAG: sugar ABC transporter permease [Anaerolineae bacterium]|nr:sugar ABC transporter permease [Anaerolineae bacterium]
MAINIGPPQAEVRRAQGFALSFNQRRYLAAALLLLPVILLRLFTSFYPFAQTILLAFQEYNPAFPPREYVGLQNFYKLSTDMVVTSSVEFTLIFVFGSTLFQVVLGILVASLLNAKFRLRNLARTINLIPWAIPMVVAAVGWRWLFDGNYGMIPDLLSRIGIEYDWLIDPTGARIAVLIVSIWKSTPFVAVTLLAGLQGVPEELYEAAKVDGANALQSFWRITIPLIMPLMVTIGMYMLVWQLAVFDLPFTMTAGGPGFATSVLAYKIYQEITTLNYGYASAISVVMFGIVGAIGALGLIVFRRVQLSL